MKQIISVHLKVCRIILFIIFVSSCHKINSPPPPVPLSTILADGPWQLISSTNYNSIGIIDSIYKGTPADSLLFLWKYDSNYNVKPSYIYSFIRGNNASYGYKILVDKKPDPFTPVVCSTVWKVSYSDTLMVKFCTEYLLIFQVGYSNISGSGIEIDSLKKIRFNK
jgi:hypothetical protein